MKKNVILVAAIVVAAMVFCTNPVPALPTADVFGIEDAGGYKNTYVEVPVYLTNVQDGVVSSIIFNIEYDNDVVLVVDVETGDLTSFWDTPAFNSNFEWGTRVSIVYDGVDEHAIQEGSSGSVVSLNFSVIGDGNTMMELSDIQLAGHPDYQLGTAPPKNGLFSVLTKGAILGQIEDNTGAGLDNVTLTLMSDSILTTMTNEMGRYNFSGLPVGDYCIELAKTGYWGNAVNVTVNSGRTTTMNIQMPLKGDYNDNGIAADAGDLSLIKDASVWKIVL